jgi:hypothetical protein
MSGIEKHVHWATIEVELESTLIEHAGRDDVHEQRELDQSVEGIIHVAQMTLMETRPRR